MNVYAYRKHLSLVAQEATLFKGTIRENILLGVDTATTTDAQLHQACRDASIHDFIVSLPEGYNTNIGSRGVSLSGGQKQRLAIARALIRDPNILLLDEATSSLDSESEKLVQAAFERAGKGRTMVVVAHRLATVQNADIIFVLGEGGVLLEKGSHVELLKKKGAYWQMVSHDHNSFRTKRNVLMASRSVKVKLWIGKLATQAEAFSSQSHHNHSCTYSFSQSSLCIIFRSLWQDTSTSYVSARTETGLETSIVLPDLGCLDFRISISITLPKHRCQAHAKVRACAPSLSLPRNSSHAHATLWPRTRRVPPLPQQCASSRSHAHQA